MDELCTNTPLTGAATGPQYGGLGRSVPGDGGCTVSPALNISVISGQVRPDVRQNYTLYGAVPAAINLRRIKVNIIQLVNCALLISR